MKPILEIKNVSKKFRLIHNKQPYLSLRDTLVSVFKREKTVSEEFYALNDVSFNVNPGDSIGIIGKNGAGKSTLLKILSKITPPTSGSIKARGRIASLLEVGTGFHPELTGRENIFLNGSILGMKQKEIRSKFDEIVDFSGTEKFLDTPLKHFSTGMQLRLAFAVAAFLEPEILVIDEVLAVGDAEFQKKSMGKMEEVGRSGRTILFVSHQLGSVKQLCKKAICLQAGKIAWEGEAQDVINKYLANSKTNPDFFLANRSKEATHGKELYFTSIYCTDANQNKKSEFFHSDDIYVVFETEGENKLGFKVIASIMNMFESPVFTSQTIIEGNKTILKISHHFLMQGTYSVRAGIQIPNIKLEDLIENAFNFNVVDLDSHLLEYSGINYFFGSVTGNCEWIKS